MFGHEDIRAAIRDHVAARVPQELARMRAARGVTAPPDPVAYLLGDTLLVSTRYPVVLVRSPDMSDVMDVGEGQCLTRYRVEVVGAVEVPTSGASAAAFAAASVERDRLSAAIRVALLVPSATLPPEVTIAGGTLTEAHGPAAETLLGRSLAVSATSVDVTVIETMPTGPPTAEAITAGDVTTSLASQPETI